MKYTFLRLQISLILIYISTIISIVKEENKGEFTQPMNHQLHKISGAVMVGGEYIVFVDKKWSRKDGKSYSNLKYAHVGNKTVQNLTKQTYEYSDNSPIVSEKYNSTIFFLRTQNQRTHLYYINFDPDIEPTEPKKLSNYALDISNIKIKGDLLVFSAAMYYDCSTMECTAKKNEEVNKRGDHTYREYTKLMVRHWDHWYTEGKADHPFYQKISVKSEGVFQLVGQPVDMLLADEICSPPLEGGSDSFSISKDENLVAFAIHKKDRIMSYNTKWDIVVYNIKENKTSIITQEENGRCQNPQFANTNNNLLAYFCMPRYGLESDQLHVKVYDLSKKALISNGTNETYKNFPSSLIWKDETKLTFYLISVEVGHMRLYLYDHLNTKSAFTRLTDDDNAYSSIFYLDDDTIYVSYSSWMFPTVIGSLQKGKGSFYESKILINLNEEELSKYELTLPMSFNFPCTLNDTCQGWIMKPIKFQQGKKYPLAFLIHGGPEGTWDPAWSFRWNPQNWASRGYAVVMINPHGSSGCGIDFQDAVRNDWGGNPHKDLVIGWEYVNKTYSDWIDMTKVGGCGASYGGFMVNWIQGHNEDEKFKCLITHDGVFSTITMFYATEEMWFPMSEYCPRDKWGCTPFKEGFREGFEKFNPEAYVKNWKTPHLIIHGSMDFRIPITEGVSAFAALRMRNVTSRFLHFPDENHWVLQPENSIKWYEEVLDWMDRFLK